MTPFRYFVPTEIFLGPGALANLDAVARRTGGRALVVTGRQSARKTGILDKALAHLPGAAVFDQVEENPTTVTCMAGAERSTVVT